VLAVAFLWWLADQLSRAAWVAKHLPEMSRFLGRIPQPPKISSIIILSAVGVLLLTYGTDVIDRHRHGLVSPKTRVTFSHDDGLVSEYFFTPNGGISMRVHNLVGTDSIKCGVQDPDGIGASEEATQAGDWSKRRAIINYPDGFSGAPSVIDGPYEVSWTRVLRYTGGFGVVDQPLFTDVLHIKDRAFAS
jgi:hypothetical protein